MTDTRGERRAETAKRNDDSALIEAADRESLPSGRQGSGGGNLQRDLATRAERERVEDPQAHQSVKKGDHFAQGQHGDEPRPATEVVTKRD